MYLSVRYTYRSDSLFFLRSVILLLFLTLFSQHTLLLHNIILCTFRKHECKLKVVIYDIRISEMFRSIRSFICLHALNIASHLCI